MYYTSAENDFILNENYSYVQKEFLGKRNKAFFKLAFLNAAVCLMTFQIALFFAVGFPKKLFSKKIIWFFLFLYVMLNFSLGIYHKTSLQQLLPFAIFAIPVAIAFFAYIKKIDIYKETPKPLMKIFAVYLLADSIVGILRTLLWIILLRPLYTFTDYLYLITSGLTAIFVSAYAWDIKYKNHRVMQIFGAYLV